MPRESLEREMHFLGAALQRQVADAAKRAAIPFSARVVRDDPLSAVASACAEKGPWNVVAIAETFGAGDEKRLAQVFASVIDTTGVVIAGTLGASARKAPSSPRSSSSSAWAPCCGRRSAWRPSPGGDVKLMLIGSRPDELAWLEGEARLLFGEGGGPQIETVLAATADVVPVAEAVRRHKGAFLLAQYGGQVVSAETSLRPLSSALECPLLLVR